MTTIPSDGKSSVDTSYQAEQAAAPSPGVDLDGNGVLDPYEQQQAAVSLAPVLYFAPGECVAALVIGLDWSGSLHMPDHLARCTVASSPRPCTSTRLPTFTPAIC